MYASEALAEVTASEQAMIAAITGIEEMTYLRGQMWHALVEATDRYVVIDPNSARARSDVGRAAGRLTRVEVSLAELTVARNHNLRRMERIRL